MTTIITKFGVGAPTRNDLEIAELAVDATTGDLYTKLGDTSVVKVNGSSVYNDAGIKADLAAETQDRVDGDAALQGQIDDLDLSGAIEEAPEDGKQYARQDAAWAEIQAAGGGNGNPVVISDNPPASPEEGDLWYSSKADDEGLYCWDGEVWFEAGGANGADGEDGQDGKQIWSETTPDGDIYYDKGNVSVSGSVSIGDKNDDVDRKQILHLGASRPWSFVQNGTGANQRLQLYSEVGGNKVFSIGSLANPSYDVIEFFAESGNIRARGDITGNTLRGTRVVQDGSPVIDAKGLINTLSTLRNATKDETTLEGLRDSIGNAIGGLIENLEHEIAVTMEISK